MTETNLLIGSLSNDLMRVASLIQRGSHVGAEKFYEQAQRWASQLGTLELKQYIQKIITELNTTTQVLNLATAEKLLMYSVLLQNYSLHQDDSSN